MQDLPPDVFPPDLAINGDMQEQLMPLEPFFDSSTRDVGKMEKYFRLLSKAKRSKGHFLSTNGHTSNLAFNTFCSNLLSYHRLIPKAKRALDKKISNVMKGEQRSS